MYMYMYNTTLYMYIMYMYVFIAPQCFWFSLFFEKLLAFKLHVVKTHVSAPALIYYEVYIYYVWIEDKAWILVCLYTCTMIQTWLCDLHVHKYIHVHVSLQRLRLEITGCREVGHDAKSSAVVLKHVYQYLQSDVTVLQISHYS